MYGIARFKGCFLRDRIPKVALESPSRSCVVVSAGIGLLKFVVEQVGAFTPLSDEAELAVDEALDFGDRFTLNSSKARFSGSIRTLWG